MPAAVIQQEQCTRYAQAPRDWNAHQQREGIVGIGCEVVWMRFEKVVGCMEQAFE
jgi:hypothetical protein